ncbi:hypothetical protein [Roseivirga spongicola]|uniref:Cell surface protein SprA n=1 Tax=Roseivirga spongicola TaxID=333140 RepID=A0A150XBM0_9BACT|nr:hypothetical protein [Roseivirga spongicola]KYG76064.1 hypothetical protein AWW68_09610 [Roseivirga spongicola]WPZ10359.1 hypothetical protein T7867_19030 [Roseivirga spongicola]
MQRWSLVLLLTLIGSALAAQSSSEACKWVKTDSPQILDSLTVFPESIRITEPDSSQAFQFDLNTNTISFQNSPFDSVRVCYRTLPFDLHSTKANKTLDIYDSTALFKDVVLYQQALAIPKREEVISTENIYKTGSISRGVSFGNRQDVFVNSTLNLQMEGQLTENVNLRAVITDRNVPFQPEGNTQQIQDFDNVFIELFNEDKWRLKGGDVVLQNGESNFLRYYKNVQGAQFTTKYKMAGGFEAETTVAGSVAKGRFASVSIDPIEGVLGPYRVKGPNNERFIIILAGSEKVFIDGEQMTRGFDNDYVIDYNLGEITFTNEVLITKFTRIRVDYEYSDQNYSRSIIQASHYQRNDKLNFAFNYYNEKDNRNQPLLFDLSDEEKVILANAGDDLDNAVTSRVDSVEYNPDLILYRKTEGQDALGVNYDIYQYSTNPDSAFFDVRFTEVGFGGGNYVLRNTTANGRIYDWVAPVNGQAQGNYEPIAILNAPNQRSMVTLAGGVKLNKTDELQAEVAFSKNDVNLYSEQDSEDDDGLAYKVSHETEGRSVSFLPNYKLNSTLSYEYNSESFSFIDRLRYIEFDRDWSYNPEDFNQSFTENIFNAGFDLSKDASNNLSYKLVRRKRGEAVDGFQQYLNLSKRLGRFQLKSDAYLMNNDQQILKSEWNRFNLDFSYRSKWLIPGYKYRIDRNSVVNSTTSEVVRSAMNFEEYSFYLRNSDTLRTTYGIEYQLREDRLPINGELVDNNQSRTFNAFFRTNIDNTNQLYMLFTYRNLENLNEAGEDRNDETIMGRIDWSGSFFDGIIRSDLNYNLANSRELRREFIFIQVPTGEGTHTWRDDNGDGVQDLNEFYLAVNPDEKNYAKIFVPTDTFEEAFNTIITYRFNLNFPLQWSSEKGIRKMLSHFSNTTAWGLNAKITDDDLGQRLLPTNVPDAEVLGYNENLRSTLFFNKSNAVFGADVGIARLENKQLLVNGFEDRLSEDFRYHLRWNINRGLNLDLNFVDGQRVSRSDVLTQRNYRVVSENFNPSLTLQPSRNLRFTASYAFKDKGNVFTETSTEKAELTELGLGARFSKAVQTSITANFKYIDIKFEGTETSPVGYELLEALRPGTNLTWNLNWQQKLGSGLQLLVRYDGRKSEGSPVVHLGRVQVTALF